MRKGCGPKRSLVASEVVAEVRYSTDVPWRCRRSSVQAGHPAFLSRCNLHVDLMSRLVDFDASQMAVD